LNWDMIADVDGLQNSEGGRLRCVKERIGGTRLRRGGMCDNPPRKIPYYRLNQTTLVIK
jgi:hypothetical protein